MKVERGNECRMRLKEKSRLAICYSHPNERRKVTECSKMVSEQTKAEEMEM